MSTCLKCRHWKQADEQAGTCHRYPPRYIEPHEVTGVVAMMVKSGEIAKRPDRWAFPATSPDTHCGEFSLATDRPDPTPAGDTQLPAGKTGWFLR